MVLAAAGSPAAAILAAVLAALTVGLVAGWWLATSAYVRRARRWHAQRLADTRAGDVDWPPVTRQLARRPYDHQTET